MKLSYFKLLAFLILSISTSCDNFSKNKELDLRQQELNIKQKELEIKEKELEKNLPGKGNQTDTLLSYSNENYGNKSPTLTNSPQSKFAFAVFYCNFPTLKKIGSIDPLYLIETEKYILTSQIKEIKNFSEDEKYKLQDDLEALAKTMISGKVGDILPEIVQAGQSQEEINKLLTQAKESAKIYKREMKIFDSYKDASITREKFNRE